MIQIILQFVYNIINRSIMFPFNLQQPQQTWPTQGVVYYQQNLKPYQSQKFLNQVFNYNKQSIQAFHTLSHELKLNFYLNVQEMKLLGYMSDKVAYQNILQQIAKRAQILKKPTNVSSKFKQQDLWGAKLQNLLDGHLKKLQQDIQNPVHGSLSSYNNNFDMKKYRSQDISTVNFENLDDQQFQWAQSKAQTENFNSPMKSFDQILEDLNLKKKKSEVKKQNNSSNYQNSKKSQINNSELSVNFSRKIQQQPVEIKHIDVWDLQIIQDETQNMKKKPSQKQNELKRSNKLLKQNQTPQLISKTRINEYQPTKNQMVNNHSNINNFNYNQGNYFLANHEQKVKENQKQSTANTGVHSDASESYSSHFANENSQGFNVNFNSYKDQQKENQTQNQQIQNGVINHNTLSNGIYINSKTENFEEQDEFQQFQQVQAVQTQQQVKMQPLNSNDDNKINEFKADQNKNQNNQPKADIFDAVVVETAPINKEFQFDFLASLQQPPKTLSKSRSGELKTSKNIQSSPSQQVKTHNLNYTMQFAGNSNIKQFNLNFDFEPSFSAELSSFANNQSRFRIDKMDYSQQFTQTNEQLNNNFHKKYQQIDQFNSDLQNANSMINSTIMAIIDLAVLLPLKRTPNIRVVSMALRKKTFDFDRQFYQQALTLIETLQYEKNPDYKFLKQQQYICGQIFRLTQLYSAAVDQDQQEQIMRNFKQCKKLCAKVDSTKTAEVVKKYIKMEGQTLSYQIGKLSLQVGVPKQLIQKAVKSPQFNIIATILYLMVYFGSTYSISLFACQVVEYVEHLYLQMLQFQKQLNESSKQCKILFKKSQKYPEYKENLNKISKIAKRVLELSNHCEIDEQYIDQKLINQKLEAMSKRSYEPNQQQLIPSYFLQFFSDFACSKNNNIYQLHSRMTQFIDSHPLCCLCLHPVQQNNDKERMGAKRNDNKYYHFKCWNFRSEVIRFKNKLMQQQAEILRKQSQQANQNVQQNGQDNPNSHIEQSRPTNNSQIQDKEQDEWVQAVQSQQ